MNATRWHNISVWVVVFQLMLCCSFNVEFCQKWTFYGVMNLSTRPSRATKHLSDCYSHPGQLLCIHLINMWLRAYARLPRWTCISLSELVVIGKKTKTKTKPRWLTNHLVTCKHKSNVRVCAELTRPWWRVFICIMRICKITVMISQ